MSVCVCVGGWGTAQGMTPIQIGSGVPIRNFGKKRYQDPALWAWLEFFSPLRGTNGHFRYIKIQLDSEAQRTQTEEMNKYGHSIFFVCVLLALLPC